MSARVALEVLVKRNKMDSVGVEGQEEALERAVEHLLSQVDDELNEMNDGIEKETRELIGLQMRMVEMKMDVLLELSTTVYK